MERKIESQWEIPNLRIISEIGHQDPISVACVQRVTTKSPAPGARRIHGEERVGGYMQRFAI